VATPGNGRLILLSAIAGTVLLPVAACGAGGEGRIACATRAFVVTAMSVVPGLVIGFWAGCGGRRGANGDS
jgi:hypothetical protein